MPYVRNFMLHRIALAYIMAQREDSKNCIVRKKRRCLFSTAEQRTPFGRLHVVVFFFVLLLICLFPCVMQCSILQPVHENDVVNALRQNCEMVEMCPKSYSCYVGRKVICRNIPFVLQIKCIYNTYCCDRFHKRTFLSF